MKNKFKKVFLLLLTLLVPISFVLTGCGATPTHTARGIFFISDLKDEKSGHSLFEVDLNKPFKIPYKINPSSWSGYKISWTTPGEGENQTYFQLIDGEITVKNDKFKPITVKVMVNGTSDICVIKLKEYPVHLRPKESEMDINAFGVKTICPMGSFKSDPSKFVPLSEDRFNFLVESSDPEAIKVFNNHRLTICSTRGKGSFGPTKPKPTVRVTLCDTTWKSKGVHFEIPISIIENANTGHIKFKKGYDKYINNGDEITINVSDLDLVGENRVINYDMFVISVSGKLITPKIECTTTNDRYVQVDDANKQIKLKLVDNLTISVTIWTDLIDGDFNSFAVTFKINLKV